MTRFLLAFTLLASAAIVRADEAADVVKKAVEAHGGEAALKKGKAGEATLTGEIVAQGTTMKFKARSAYMMPDKYSMAFDTELMNMKLTMENVVNGGKYKTIIDRMPQKLTDAQKGELQAAFQLQEMILIYPLLDAKKYTLKAEKDAKVGDADVKVLSVTPKAGREVKLSFDKKSGLLVKTARKALNMLGAEVDEEAVFSDFDKIDGIQTAKAFVVTQNGEPYMKAKIVEMKYLDKVDEKKFNAD